MNIIEAWTKAQKGDFIEKTFPGGSFTFEKTTNYITPGIYDAVEYAKQVYNLSSNDWDIREGLTVGSYRVTNITNKGFKVGCQEVTWDTAEKIMALRPKGEKE